MTNELDGDPGCWQRLRNVLSLTRPGATPVEWPTVIFMITGLFGGCYSFTFIFPFLPEMMLFFGYREEDKGYYTGIVASSIFIGGIVSSYFWGWLSDRKGRRVVMVTSLVLMSIVTVAFGFATNLTSAIVLRLLAGACNALVGVGKTIICDISDDSNQAMGMSAISISWGLGMTIGPLVSGLAADPAKKYPQYFSEDGLFGRYPYLLPSIFAGVVCFVPAIVIFFKLPETRHRKTRAMFVSDKKLGDQLGNEEQLVEMMPKGPSHDEDVEGATQDRSRIATADLEKGDAKSASGNQPDASVLLHLKDGDGNGPSSKGDEANGGIQTSTRRRACLDYVKNTDVYKILATPGVSLTIVLYSLISFCAIGMGEIFAVWASTEIHLHGLGFGTDEIGMAFGLSSVPLLFLQLYTFPALESRYGCKKLCWVSGLFLIFLATTRGVARILLPWRTLLWTCIILYMALSKLFSMICFSAVSMLMNNSVPPDKVGSVNGIGMTFSTLARGLAPPVGGSIFAWSITSGATIGIPFDVNLVFITFGGVFFVSNVVCGMTPTRLDHRLTAGHGKTS